MMDTVTVTGLSRPISRLGFGCGSLAGGTGLKQSLKLVEAALESGISHFDVAPSYGLGMAEQVLGGALESNDASTVTTKAGVAPPRHGWAKSLARSMLKPLLANVPAVKDRLVAMAQAQSAGGSVLGASDIQASFHRSLDLLRRDRLDIFLVHEPQAEIDSEVVDLLEHLRAAGRIGAWGSGTGGELDRLPNMGRVRQFAWRPVSTNTHTRDRINIRHGLLRLWLPRLRSALATDPTLMSHSDALGFDLADPDALASLMLTLALASDPQGVVLIASNDPDRIRRSIAGISWAQSRSPSPSFMAASEALSSRMVAL
jgi:predicted aldo/keto reductase-like oxidoreductase